MMRKVLFVVVLMSMLGCAGTGEIIYHKKDYEKGSLVTEKWIEVEQPSNATTPARLEWGESITNKGVTGRQQAHDFVMEGISSYTSWAGIFLVIAGLALTAGSGYFPMIKWNKGLILIGGGFALLWFPVIIDRYTWVLVAGVAGVGLLFAEDLYYYFSSEQEE